MAPVKLNEMAIVDSKIKALARVKRFLETEKRIPQLPQILLRIEAALENPEIGGEELGRAILDDPALTAQVLKVANSTFYNPRGTKIDTVSRAIVILGFDNIRRLVLGLSVSKMFTLLPRWSVYRRLWRHSLATAVLARELARADGCKEVEAAFVGGLIHDVGKLILGHLQGEDYAEILERWAGDPELDLCQVESQAFYCNHQEVGELLAQSWGLPKELARLMGRHRPGPGWRYFKDALPGLAAYVILANQMAHLLDLQSCDGGRVIFENEALYQQRVADLRARAGNAFGISQPDFMALLENLAATISELAASLDIALDDLRLDESGGPSGRHAHGLAVKKIVDRQALFEITMKLSELALMHEEFSAYVEVSAGQLYSALGLELLIIYLPGSKDSGLAPGFCFGSGKLAESLRRMALAADQDNIINRVFNSGQPATSGKPPGGSLSPQLESEFWAPERVVALPLKDLRASGTCGVLLVLRNLQTVSFNRDEMRLLELYSGLLGARLGS